MKILLTGHSGFVGRALFSFLKKQSLDVKGYSRENGYNLEELSSSDKLPDADLIIHLAGKVGVLKSWENPEVFYRSNYLTTLAAAEYSRKRKVPLVYVSSYMYGIPNYLPIDENHATNCNNPYAYSKKMAEDIISSYHNLFDISTVIIRPMNLYGEGMPLDNLIGSIFNQIKNGTVIKVQDLSPKRDYMHIEDLCKAIHLIIVNKISGFEIFNLGYGKSYSVQNLIQEISRIMKTEFEIEETEIKRLNEINDCYADTTRFLKKYNWKPEIDLQKGLQMLMEVK